jgi:predicted secreted protein
MSTTTAVAVFILIWWVVLFTVLPWGVQSQHEAGAEAGAMAPGTDPGAPTNFRLGQKLLWTTVVSGVIYAVCYVVYVEHLVTIDGLMAPFVSSKTH